MPAKRAADRAPIARIAAVKRRARIDDRTAPPVARAAVDVASATCAEGSPDPKEQDPETVVGLIYRVVSDWARLARMSILMLFVMLLVDTSLGLPGTVDISNAAGLIQCAIAGSLAAGVAATVALRGRKAARRPGSWSSLPIRQSVGEGTLESPRSRGKAMREGRTRHKQ
jgi:hypothetical protein